MSQVLIIGGGIIGLSVAYKLGMKFPKLSISVLEKEDDVGKHQSGNNSGVLHAGLSYKPGSFKAKLAVNGIRQMKAFCDLHEIPYEICGKLVIATTIEESHYLVELLKRGKENGLNGLRQLNRDEILEFEPYAHGVSAVYVPEEGIVDFSAVCRQLAALIVKQNGEVQRNHNVLNLRLLHNRWEIRTSRGGLEADFIINCAGLYCDRICKMAGESTNARIIPFRGEYFRIRDHRSHLVRNLIYPVPNPEFPFLGVHFSRSIKGGIEAGPNAVLAMAREGYKKFNFNPGDFWDSVSYRGLWKFLGKHYKTCFNEICQSLRKNLFCNALKRLVPEIEESDLEKGGAGVRAQAIMPNGSLVNDFLFIRNRRILHVLNAPSPAATASLAIADQIVEDIQNEFC